MRHPVATAIQPLPPARLTTPTTTSPATSDSRRSYLVGDNGTKLIGCQVSQRGSLQGELPLVLLLHRLSWAWVSARWLCPGPSYTQSAKNRFGLIRLELSGSSPALKLWRLRR